MRIVLLRGLDVGFALQIGSRDFPLPVVKLPRYKAKIWTELHTSLTKSCKLKIKGTGLRRSSWLKNKLSSVIVTI